MFLYTVISQMYLLVIKSMTSIRLTAGSNITFLIPITFKVVIDTGQKEITSQVEFTVVEEKRLFYVLLDYPGSV